jgi:streptogrisin C
MTVAVALPRLAPAAAPAGSTGPAAAAAVTDRPVAPPVSPAIAAALQRDLRLTATQVRVRAMREATATMVERELRARLDDRFGGAWLSADGAALVVGSTEPADRALVRAAGARLAVVRWTEGRLNRAKARLDQLLVPAPRGLPGWYVDLPGNRVVMLARPAAVARARQLLAAAGVADMARIVVSAEAPRPRYDVRGGDAFYIGSSRCSIGFSVVGGYVAAGHCAALTSGSIGGYNGVGQGAWGAYSFPGNDYGWVRTNSSWTPRGVVNSYNGNPVPVYGGQEAAVNSSVCRSGSTTGWRCGVITSKNQTVNYQQGTVYGHRQPATRLPDRDHRLRARSGSPHRPTPTPTTPPAAPAEPQCPSSAGGAAGTTGGAASFGSGITA